MMETTSSGVQLLDAVMWVWFALTALSVAYVAQDQFGGASEEKSLAMKTMRWGWVLLTLYTGVLALVVYGFLHRASAQETGGQSGPPLWKQSIESTIHCVAGDATGILLAAVVTSWLRLPMSLEVVVEYIAGFAVGVFVFQALCMKAGFEGSYWRAVKGTVLAETLSMNAVMAAMIPVMVILMSRDMSAMDPGSARFWWTMSLSFVAGTVMTYPVNWWLVKCGIKHGTGGEARARLCSSVSVWSKLSAAFLTFALLAGGVALAGHYGDFAMRAGDHKEMGADSGQIRKTVQCAKAGSLLPRQGTQITLPAASARQIRQ